MKKILLALISTLVFACTSDEEAGKVQYLAVCSFGNGCEFSELLLDQRDVDLALGREHFWAQAGPNATLILEGCVPEVDEERTIEEIHADYGGTGDPRMVEPVDIARYISGMGCFECDTETKKLSFEISSVEVSGSAYFYINFKDKESFMPNAAYQQFYKGAEGIREIVMDQLMRNGFLEQYIIDQQGGKYMYRLPVQHDYLTPVEGEFTEGDFKKAFKKTGNKRRELGMYQEEYEGFSEEGEVLKFWLGSTPEICLAPDQFAFMGMYGIGYIKIDGVTYLLTEASIPGYNMRVTKVEKGSYSFNPSGYTRLN
jgi:hypothetical protein